tara:strand:+ start:423 stop:683 length:261 start_codon:yes stop_codon:yes gene_type:complete
LKFLCHPQSKLEVYFEPLLTTLLISQYSLPFFGENCKHDSDDAGKPKALINIMAEMVLIKQIAANLIDTGQLLPSAPIIGVIKAPI